MLITDIALITANFNMRKALDIITIVTGVLVLGILGTGVFTYRTVTSEKFQKQMMDKVLGGVSGMMPKVLDQSLPEVTGPSIPSIPKL